MITVLLLKRAVGPSWTGPPPGQLAGPAACISVHTTFLTGVATDVITTEAEKYTSRAARHQQSTPNPKVSLLCEIWLACVLGATTGATMVLRFEALGIFGAALLLLSLMIAVWVRAQPSATTETCG
jgi:uncharacterized membrane protein YoaK (UPF0700 family)